MIRVGINGFGRIGRTLTRAVWARPDCEVEVVAANDIQPIDQLAYLLDYDTTAGRLLGGVIIDGATLRSSDHAVRMLSSSTPEELPWGDLGVDVVVESSRRFSDADQARRHLASGARLVVVSAPSAGADATFVYGVNHDTFDSDRHAVISNASCTTNCLAPMAKILDEAFGIEDGLMTTVHAYTTEQALIDGATAADRRSRAAAVNIVPTTSGAARATRHVLPHLDGHLDGAALRVPVPDGSITDLTAALRTRASVDEINDAFRQAADGPLRGIVGYSTEPIVSSDIIGRPESCIIDAPLTTVSGRLAKIYGWYDNEWGYSNRLVDLIEHTAARVHAAV